MLRALGGRPTLHTDEEPAGATEEKLALHFESLTKLHELRVLEKAIESPKLSKEPARKLSLLRELARTRQQMPELERLESTAHDSVRAAGIGSAGSPETSSNSVPCRGSVALRRPGDKCPRNN